MMVQALEKAFISKSDSSRIEAMKAYMKHQFEFYGLTSPVRKDIQKSIFPIHKPQDYCILEKDVRFMWSQKQREWHYAAIDCLAANKKLWKPEMIHLVDYMLVNNSWWDSVDGISSQVAAPFFKKFPNLKTEWINKWKLSDNMWLRRVSIIHQLKDRASTDTDLLTECILLNSDSKEFFLQKAIGWALREYAKTNPEWVIRFVEVNDLKPLSKREAVKNIQR